MCDKLSHTPKKMEKWRKKVWKFIKAIKKVHLLFRRPSRTLYTKSWNAKSTAGLCGRCVNVFGCAGTICNLIAPLFLFSSNKRLLLQSVSAILVAFNFRSICLNDLVVSSLCSLMCSSLANTSWESFWSLYFNGDFSHSLIIGFVNGE